MDRRDAEKMARELMEFWECTDWKFVWSDAMRTLGSVVEGKVPGTAGFVRRELRLSRYVVDRNDEAQVRDTILHEIAHIRAGLANGHNQIWKDWCLKVGANPQRCADSLVQMADPLFIMYCTVCDRSLRKFYRRPRRDYSRAYCKMCGIAASLGKIVLKAS